MSDNSEGYASISRPLGATTPKVKLRSIDCLGSRFPPTPKIWPPGPWKKSFHSFSSLRTAVVFVKVYEIDTVVEFSTVVTLNEFTVTLTPSAARYCTPSNRGIGVGVGLGVGVGVGVGLGVRVGVGVGFGVGVGGAVGEEVANGARVGLGGRVGEAVGVGA